MNLARRFACASAIILVATGAVGVAHADSTKPYGDNVTSAIADKLHGTARGGWLATTLDIHGYHGRRHAELVRIPAGHGKRWIGVIHVPATKADAARSALEGVYLVKRGTAFVVPLTSEYNTDGGSGAAHRQAAKWAAKRLGRGWHLIKPAL